MTVVAALRHSGGVVMGCDSLVTDASDYVAYLYPWKVFRHGSAVFGMSGWLPMCGLIRYGLPLEEPGSDVDAWAHEIACRISELRKTSADGNASTMLLAWRSHLWELDDCQAFPIEHYAAVGSGRAVALGALDVLVDIEPDPVRCVQRAVEAACRHIVSCGQPSFITCTSTQ